MKRFTRRINRQPKKKNIRIRKKASSFAKRRKRQGVISPRLVGSSIAILILGGVMHMLSTTLLSSTYRIQEVRFSPESINVYDNPAMYNHIRDELHNKNYYRIKRQERDTIRQNFLKIFPIVRDISLEQSVPQRVYITLDFYEPTLVFRSPAGNTAAFDNSLFPLTSGNTLGNTTLTIDIPRYTSGYDSLHGMLYAIDERQLAEYIHTIVDTLGEQHISEIIFLPGGMKLFLTYKGKQIYFHLDQEVNRQLAKLVDLENRYENFENIRTIDIGSIDDTIVR